MIATIPLVIPAHLREQLDGERRRITCSWGEWIDHSEAILGRQNIRRVLLADWPEIDLPETRREAEISITRQYPGIRFEVLKSADDRADESNPAQ